MDLDLTSSCSWIPTKALREAADLKLSLKSLHRKSSSEFSTKLPLTLSVIETPKNFPSLNITTLESTSQKSFQIFPTEKKYLLHVRRLNLEIQLLSDQLKQANDMIKTLAGKLADCSTKHAMNLQAIQERHEQKLKRNQKELELILQTSSSFTENEVNKLKDEFFKVLSQQQSDFDLRIMMVEKKCADVLEKKEAEFQQKESFLRQSLTSVIFDLKTRFEEDMKKLKSRYKEKMNLVSRNK